MFRKSTDFEVIACAMVGFILHKELRPSWQTIDLKILTLVVSLVLYQF